MGAFVPGNVRTSIRGRYSHCGTVVHDVNNVSLRLLNVNGGKRVNFGRPSSSFTGRARYISLARGAVRTGTHFFSFVRRIPARTCAANVGGVVRTQRVLLVTDNRTGTSTLCRTICKPVAPRMPTSVLRLRSRISIITSRTTLSHVVGRKLV